jgi:hypothetical protein
MHRRHALLQKTPPKIVVTHGEVVATAPQNIRGAARKLVTKIARLHARLQAIESYRQQANFEYWKTRCEAEQTYHAIQAYTYMLRANKLYNQDADFDGARKAYEQAWNLWAVFFKVYPSLIDDVPDNDLGNGQTLLTSIRRYQTLLQQQDAPNLDEDDLPKDFKLKKLVEMYKKELSKKAS